MFNDSSFGNRILIKLGGLTVSEILISLLFLYVKLQGLSQYIRLFPSALLVEVLLLMVANVCVVAYRYHRILIHCGFILGWWSVFRENVVANIASMLITPLMGQRMGRQAILREAGISLVKNSAIVACERVLVGLLRAGLAILGDIHLVGKSMDGLLKDSPLIEVAILVVFLCAGSVSLVVFVFQRMIAMALFTMLNFAREMELPSIMLRALWLRIVMTYTRSID